MLTAPEAKTLYAAWQQDPSGDVDLGATRHVGLFLADEIQPDHWEREATALSRKLLAVFTHCEPDQAADERVKRVAQIVLRGQFYAADELEAREQRALHAAKVVPIADLKRQREKTESLGVEKLSTVLMRVVKELEQPQPVISTPFPGLNHLMLGGFRAGELTLLGARPGMGKSAFALEVMRHVAQRGQAVLFVSREMSNEALTRRLIAQDGQINAGDLRTGKRLDWQRVTQTTERLYALPVYLTQTVRTVPMIAAAIKAVPECALVIVDYLQILSAPKELRDRRLQVEHLSAGLKALAMEHGVPVFVLSSLSRPETKSKSTAPGMASLRDSGALEHDADTVMLLHREPKELRTLCAIVKNRDALVGDVDLIFRPESVAFEELMSEEEERRYGN